MSDKAPLKRAPQPKPWEVLAEKRGWDAELVGKVWQESLKQGVNPMLMVAVVGWESGFKQDAMHKNLDGSTDYGLMQLNSRYHPQLKGSVDEHVAYGVTFLKDLIKRHGVEKGLGAYNAGAGMTEKAIKNRKLYTGRVLPLMKTLYKDIMGPIKEVSS
jgi:soluble lytic murein transglycosylase-like protein